MRLLPHASTGHPVGMRYASYASKDPGLYVALEQLDERIILEDGEVTCLSCHATKSQAHASVPPTAAGKNTIDSIGRHQVCTATDRLTTGANRITLCLSCHTI